MHHGVAGALLCAILLAAASAAAEPPPDPQPVWEREWWQRAALTGDWGGWRTALAERGVLPGARYTTGFWSNLDGGLETGTRYEGFAEWFVDFDLERLVGWPGGAFKASWYSYHGGQPTEDLVGGFPTQTVTGWETEKSVRFYELALQQTWGGGRFLAKVGQLAADSDFFVSDNAAALLNGTFGFLGLGREREVAPFYPLAAPGAFIRARTQDARFEVRGGVYTADPGDDKRSNFGFDWTFNNGAFFLAELEFRPRIGGLPGDYVAGLAASTAKLEDFNGIGRVNGVYALYFLIDQMLFQETAERPGLGAFFRGYGVPQGDRSPIEWYLDFGFQLTNPLPGREADALALGYAYLRFADDYVVSERLRGKNVTRQQSVLELTYRCQLTGWLSLQPNLQLVFEPNVGRRDATVIGFRAVIDL